jgi:hypothetical protein
LSSGSVNRDYFRITKWWKIILTIAQKFKSIFLYIIVELGFEFEISVVYTKKLS